MSMFQSFQLSLNKNTVEDIVYFIYSKTFLLLIMQIIFAAKTVQCLQMNETRNHLNP